MAKLDKKVALITGGNSGIGLETARLFLKEGARVVLVARNEERGKLAVQALQAPANEVIFISCDVRSSADCERTVQKTIQEFGRLDILFNNAGVIYIEHTIVDTPEAEWDETLDTILTGTYNMSRYAIPEIIKAGGGAIINNSSVFGLVGGKGVAAYCAAKGGLIMLTKAMALDHAAQGIRVNCICPGSVDTPMLQGEMVILGGEEVMRPAFAARHPLNRISSPEEVARSVLFLACDDSSFITGAALPIDGGRSVW